MTPEQQEIYDTAYDLHLEAEELGLQQTDPVAAIPLLEEAYRLLEHGRHRSMRIRSAKVALTLGAVSLRLDKPRDAEAWFLIAIEATQAADWPKTEIDAQVALGRLLMTEDRLDEAMGLLRPAAQAATDLGDASREGQARFQLGAAHEARGALGPAMEEFRITREVLALELDPGVRAGATNEQRYYVLTRARIAGLLARTGHLEFARNQYAEVLARPEYHNPQDMTQTLASAADLAVRTGRFDEAEQLLREGWASFAQFGPLESEPTLLWVEGSLAFARGARDEACAILSRAVVLAEAREKYGPARDLHLVLSQCYLDIGAHPEAFAAAALADEGRESIDSQERWQVWWLFGRLRAATGRPDAIDAYLEAIRGLEHQMDQLVFASLTIGLDAVAAGIYDELADLLLDAGRTEEALDVLERARNRHLLAWTLGGGYLLDIPSAANEESPTGGSREEAEAAEGRIVHGGEIVRSLRGRGWDPNLMPLTSDTLEELLRTEITREDLILLGVEAIDLEVIRGHLPPGTAAVVFRVNPTTTDVFVLAPDGQLHHTLLPIGGDDVRDLVRGLLRGMRSTTPGPGSIATAEARGQAAYEALFAPFEDQLRDAEVVLLILDGSLQALPFDALHNGSNYLVEDHVFVHAPSLSIVDVLHQRPTALEPSFLGVADPGGDLPAAVAEVQHAAQGWARAEILQGAAATPTRFAEDLIWADVVHIAAHAQILSGSIPPYLELAEGTLDSTVIQQLEVHAALVTLSACKSARGGEAWINSLARAFLAAGASTVLGSLWDVDDRATAQLMKFFYDSLGDGRPPAESLALAQRAMIDTTHFNHPWYWAGFVAVGIPGHPL
jgi:CHAT domain-containing protein/tetratricopeptide (TPR) repeat protein